MKKITNFQFIFLLFIIIFSFNSCGIYKKTDAREIPTSGIERAKKNVEEGRGVSLKNLYGNKSTTYEFATSNPLWRASLEILDFLPLLNVDYSGGVIISDWYSNDFDNKNYLKITINFLSNEIGSNSLKITVHEKNCDEKNVCLVKLIKNSKIQEELISAILKKASQIKAENTKKK